MKKIKLFVFALVLTLGIGMLVGCNNKTSRTATKLEEKEITSFAVLTSARLSGQVLGGNYLHSQTNHSFDQSSIDEVDNYFKVLEYYLSGGNIANLVLESDYEDENGNKIYDHMIKYSVPGKDGSVSYVFHYNEVLTDEEVDDDDDKTEIEQEFEIAGIMLFGDVRMDVTGKKEIEIEEDEEEISYWFYSKIDSDNYVEMKYEKDIESTEHEEKFFVKVVKDGVTKESEIKVEVEDDKIEIKLEFKKNGVQYELKLKPTTKDGYQYVIEFEVDDDRDGKIYVKVENNVYTYKVVEDNQTYEFTVDKNVDDTETPNETTNPDGI
ncbi:MAG: hypothetical protein ACOX02_05045 [Acholeplasmatales bacterium]